MQAQSGFSEPDSSPSTSDSTNPDPKSRRGSPLAALLGASLLLVGIGAVVESGSFDR